jgi:hypothetical protein
VFRGKVRRLKPQNQSSCLCVIRTPALPPLVRRCNTESRIPLDSAFSLPVIFLAELKTNNRCLNGSISDPAEEGPKPSKRKNAQELPKSILLLLQLYFVRW